MQEKRILSIDFDYFIGTDIITRNEKFPTNITEDMSQEEIDNRWRECYFKYPEIRDIDVTSDYYTMLEYLKHHPEVPFEVSDTHKQAYYFILEHTYDNDSVHITNVDFHHDYYFMWGSKVTCANWLMRLCSYHVNADVLWIKREDSETISLGGEFPYSVSEDMKSLKDSYDYIFICYSPEWTPPHLRHYYEELLSAISC